MNGYLVLARCGQDDMPLYLFDNIEDARAQANNLMPEDVIGVADMVFDNDISDVINVGVATFIEGHIEKWEIVKSFDE